MSAAIVAQAGAGLFQFLQELTSSKSASASNSSNASNATAGTSANGSTGLLSTGGHHHKHGGGALEKLANALTSALQSANSSSGSTAADANQTITQALTKIFQNGSLTQTGATDSATSDPTDQTPDTDGTSSETSGLPDSFLQTLKSFGVTPQQFQADLGAALKAAQQNGSFDVSSVFKSFPTGSVVDALG